MMRHLTNQDSPFHAIPAGLIASTAFSNYPDTTVALYIMWKMLQVLRMRINNIINLILKLNHLIADYL